MPYPALWPQNGLLKKYFLLFESWKEFFSSSVLRYNGSPVPLSFLSYLLAESLVLVTLNGIGVGRLWLEVWLDHLLTAEPWACLSPSLPRVPYTSCVGQISGGDATWCIAHPPLTCRFPLCRPPCSFLICTWGSAAFFDGRLFFFFKFSLISKLFFSTLSVAVASFELLWFCVSHLL